MSQIEIGEADLRTLVNRAREGEEVTLVEDGRALARIGAIAQPPQAEDLPPRQLGRAQGKWKMPADFDAPLPDDLLDMFEGKM